MQKKLVIEQMEKWEVDFAWLKTKHFIKKRFNKSELPDLNAILFLIGVQELGQIKPKFSKEEKQDLMHIAVCRLMSTDGYFEFEGIDTDGWPHWRSVKAYTQSGVQAQSEYLKEKIIDYFDPIMDEEE